MGWWKAITSAFQAGRRGKAGQRSAGAAFALAVGAFLGWLAGKRQAVPPVRATGVAENAPRMWEDPPRH